MEKPFLGMCFTNIAIWSICVAAGGFGAVLGQSRPTASGAHASSDTRALAAPIRHTKEYFQNYRIVRRYQVEEDGGWDFVVIDSGAGRLYMGGNESQGLVVMDVDSGKLVGHVEGVGRIKGVTIATDLHRGFASDAKNLTAVIFDTKTLKVVKTVNLQRAKRFPDFILYDPSSKRVFPMMDLVTVLDAKTGDIVGTVELGGAPESAVSDGRGTVYVNILDRGQVAAIDSKTLTVKKRFPVKDCSPQSMSYDPESDRLLIGCDETTTDFIAVEASTGKVVGRTQMCSHVDQSGYDAGQKLIFEACSEGVVSIIRRVDDHYELTQTIPTAIGAGNMALDARTGRIYIPALEARPPLSTNWEFGHFQVLVIGQ